jgi:stage V sporulation protein SpoVS
MAEQVNGTKVMRVSQSTNAKSLGSAIARELEENRKVVVRAIGVDAINQACKGIIIANSFVGQRGKYIVQRSGFLNVKVEDIDKDHITAIDWFCEEF